MTRRQLRRVCAWVAPLLLLCAHSARAERPGGLGIGLGSGTLATGLSLKYESSPQMTYQVNIGSVGGRGRDRYDNLGGLGVSLDALIVHGNLLSAQALALDFSGGFGIGLASRNDTSAAAGAGVVGLELNFRPIPIDVTLEWRPNLLITPDVDFEAVDFTAHIRFWLP